MRASTLSLSALVLLTPLLAGCDRGAWWWGKFNTGEPGSIAAFHSAAMGASMPAVPNASDIEPILKTCGIRRLYGSYGDLPRTDPQWMWEWNSILHAWKKQSYYLLADPAWLNDHTALLDLLDARIGWWYTAPVGMSINSRFDGLHLDIEPVQFDACKTATNDPVACRALHESLLTLVTAVRGWLDAHDGSMTLYIDVHHWTDEIGGRVDWSTGAFADPALNRDAWYDALAEQVDGITVMAYHPNLLTLVGRAAWEFANVPTEVRIGIDTDDYPQIPSNGTDGVIDVATMLEFNHDQAVDIHRFNDLVLAGGCD